MKNNKSDALVIKWLEVAITSEKTALGDYLKYAHLTRDKTGKDMFIKLAQDEFQHMTILEKQKGRLRAGCAWQAMKIPTSPIEQILPLAKKNTAMTQQAAQSDESQVLGLAMKAEKQAMNFYLAQSKKTDSVSACQLLQRLAKMENAHYQILQAELDNINKTGFWMGFREISMEVE
jgi:rubrerythrin